MRTTAESPYPTTGTLLLEAPPHPPQDNRGIAQHIEQTNTGALLLADSDAPSGDEARARPAEAEHLAGAIACPLWGSGRVLRPQLLEPPFLALRRHSDGHERHSSRPRRIHARNWNTPAPCPASRTHPSQLADQPSCSLDLAQVVLDLSRRQHLELLVSRDDADLDVRVIHRALKALLERQKGSVHGVL